MGKRPLGHESGGEASVWSTKALNASLDTSTRSMLKAGTSTVCSRRLGGVRLRLVHAEGVGAGGYGDHVGPRGQHGGGCRGRRRVAGHVGGPAARVVRAGEEVGPEDADEQHDHDDGDHQPGPAGPRAPVGCEGRRHRFGGWCARRGGRRAGRREAGRRVARPLVSSGAAQASGSGGAGATIGGVVGVGVGAGVGVATPAGGGGCLRGRGRPGDEARRRPQPGRGRHQWDHLGRLGRTARRRHGR